MSKHVKHTPKHRGTPPPSVPTKAIRNTVILSGIAAGATGTVVAGGVASTSSTPQAPAANTVAAPAAAITGDLLAGRLPERAEQVSRSDRREVADPAKEATLATTDSASNGFTRTEDLTAADPRTLGRALMLQAGFGADQWSCLDSLWTKESNWRVDADNPTSSAYGIPQSLPGSKMASEGADWATNPATQIKWGLGYIADRYGSPCAAWSHSQAVNWY